MEVYSDLCFIFALSMEKFALILLAAFTFTGHGTTAQNSQLFFDEADGLFAKHVMDGKVDYAAIKEDPDALNSILKLAETTVVSPSSSKEYQAFWINAYNVFVIKGVVDNYPLRSPLDVEGFFKGVEYKAGGSSITLDAIENKKLRGVFDEPRFHFVLVCGAKGCPPIISKAYTPRNLDELLNQQTRKALNDPKFIRVGENEVKLSEIFKWYEEDFVKGGSTLLEYINSFRKEKIHGDSRVSYYPYNWSLNSMD